MIHKVLSIPNYIPRYIITGTPIGFGFLITSLNNKKTLDILNARVDAVYQVKYYLLIMHY